jgi:hypothetical protein
MTTIDRTKTKEYLRYDFTSAEMMELAKLLARSNQEHEAIDQKKKAITKELASELEGKLSEVQRFSRLVNNGHDYRDIECEVRFDSPVAGMKTIIRLDNYEVVKECKMSDEDKQSALDLQ